MRPLIFLLLALGVTRPVWAQAPDAIPINGLIVTVDAASSVQQALAMRDGRILALGTTADITSHPASCGSLTASGKSVSGASVRGPEHTPDRLTAPRLYILGSAWFPHDDDTRGSLEAGKPADLTVLSGDLMTMPVERIGGLESVNTMVGGKVVYAAGPFTALERGTR